jgi:hypothetical protein
VALYGTFCRICGEEVEPKAPDLLVIKRKKPGDTLYIHTECYKQEQKELKQNDAEKMDE